MWSTSGSVVTWYCVSRLHSPGCLVWFFGFQIRMQFSLQYLYQFGHKKRKEKKDLSHHPKFVADDGILWATFCTKSKNTQETQKVQIIFHQTGIYCKNLLILDLWFFAWPKFWTEKWQKCVRKWQRKQNLVQCIGSISVWDGLTESNIHLYLISPQRVPLNFFWRVISTSMQFCQFILIVSGKAKLSVASCHLYFGAWWFGMPF